MQAADLLHPVQSTCDTNVRRMIPFRENTEVNAIYRCNFLYFQCLVHGGVE